LQGALLGACSGAAVYAAGAEQCMVAQTGADLARERSCICAGKSAVACPIDAVTAPGSGSRAQSPSPSPGAQLHHVSPDSRIPEPDHRARGRATAPPASTMFARARRSPLERLGWPPSFFPFPEPYGTRRPFTARPPAALTPSEEPPRRPSRADARLINNGRFRAKFPWRGRAKSRFPRPP
jgi:hypothetical protein